MNGFSLALMMGKFWSQFKPIDSNGKQKLFNFLATMLKGLPKILLIIKSNIISFLPK